MKKSILTLAAAMMGAAVGMPDQFATRGGIPRPEPKIAKKRITEHSVSIAALSIIDVLAEWHCPWYWWGCGKPDKGFSCKHWEFAGKKHYI